MKKIMISIMFALVCVFSAIQSQAVIYITNFTPLQYNFRFNNGYNCGISATSPYTNVFTGPGTSATDFPFPGLNNSFVQVDPGLSPHTPSGAPMDVLMVGAPGSLFPSMATSAGIYGLMATPFTISYFVTATDIYITMAP